MPVCKSCGKGANVAVFDYKPKSFTVCPSPAECPDDLKCSELISAACAQYSKEGMLLCDSSYILINTNEDLQTVIENLVAYICEANRNNTALIIDITASETFPSLTATVTGGVAPYTYRWELVQAPFIGHVINGSNTNYTLNLDCRGENAIQTGTFDSYIKTSLVYVHVTDAQGTRKREYFTYTSDCYNQFVTEPTSGTPDTGRLKFQTETMFGSHWYITVMDFMDDINNMPTCNELKNYCCPVEYNGETYTMVDASTLFRAQRDLYLKNLNENILAENVGFPEPYFHQPLNDSQWIPGDLADKIIFPTKSGLMLYAQPLGCPECTYEAWNTLKFPQLDNQTLSERLNGFCEKMYWLEAHLDAEQPLPIGQPGQMLKYSDGEGGYIESAWDPVTQTWSEVLMVCLDDYLTPFRARRDVWLKALNQLQLADSSFTWANDYVPFHRWKYEPFGH